jgi:pyruvate/2-oxoglutarate dehydrogenase complex dihydrolipoamide dehydrogenase (E3) component
VCLVVPRGPTASTSAKGGTIVLMEIEDVDLLVVGGGKAGKSLAMDHAKAGWSVAMVEYDKIGGTCINVACIPTKALVASARMLVAARRAAEFGVEIQGEPAISLERLRAHKEGVVGGMVGAHETLFRDSGMDFVMGSARFVAERTVEVAVNDGGTRTFRGRDVLVNTGTTPAMPELPGLAEADAWTSESILRLERLPGTVIVLGGG